MKSAIHLLRQFAVILGLIASAASAWATQQIAFTVDGTFDAAGLGYTAGQPFVFTLVMNNPAPLAHGGEINTFSNGFGSVMWDERGSQPPSPPPIWSALYGTGLTGSYIPYKGVFTQQGMVALGAPSQSTNNNLTLNMFSFTGMQVNGVELRDFQISTVLQNLLVTTLPPGQSGSNLPQQLPPAYDLFLGYLGTYARDTVYSTTNGLWSANGTRLTFQIDHLTISAVPEPSILALGLGGGLLVAMVVRRKRNCRRVNTPLCR